MSEGNQSIEFKQLAEKLVEGVDLIQKEGTKIFQKEIEKTAKNIAAELESSSLEDPFMKVIISTLGAGLLLKEFLEKKKEKGGEDTSSSSSKEQRDEEKKGGEDTSSSSSKEQGSCCDDDGVCVIKP
jgi:hypothetical protein